VTRFPPVLNREGLRLRQSDVARRRRDSLADSGGDGIVDGHRHDELDTCVAVSYPMDGHDTAN
jgi:hypothetical protein